MQDPLEIGSERLSSRDCRDCRDYENEPQPIKLLNWMPQMGEQEAQEPTRIDAISTR